jgi:hypothetical protein
VKTFVIRHDWRHHRGSTRGQAGRKSGSATVDGIAIARGAGLHNPSSALPLRFCGRRDFRATVEAELVKWPMPR